MDWPALATSGPKSLVFGMHQTEQGVWMPGTRCKCAEEIREARKKNPRGLNVPCTQQGNPRPLMRLVLHGSLVKVENTRFPQGAVRCTCAHVLRKKSCCHILNFRVVGAARGLSASKSPAEGFHGPAKGGYDRWPLLGGWALLIQPEHGSS